MLEDCLFASRPSRRSKKPLTLVLSVITHVTLAGALILIPLFQEQVLPQVPIFSPLRPPTVTVRTVELVPVSGQPHPSSRLSPPNALTTPTAIPSQIAKYANEPVSSDIGFLPPGPNGPGPFLPSIGIAIGDRGPVSPPLPPPAPPAAPPRPAPAVAPTTGPLPRGGDLMQSYLVYSVKPIYPKLAIATRTQGRVLIEAVITREGTIDPERVRVLSGHILLAPAAVEAVKQWRYRPTVLNGVPMEIVTTITVNFTLN